MARTPVQDAQPQNKATVERLSDAPIKDVALSPMDGKNNSVVGQAVVLDKDADEVKKPRRFLVVKGGFITSGEGNTSFRSKLHEGKEITDQQYDPAKLARQGIKLREIEEEDVDVELLGMID